MAERTPFPLAPCSAPVLLATLSAVLLTAVVAPPVSAQEAGPDTAADTTDLGNQVVGTIQYLEGSVEIALPNRDWTPASIDQNVRANARLRTGPNARVEIEWRSGAQTVVGPDHTQPIGPLFAESGQQPSGEARGVLQRFVDLFSESAPQEGEAGGIRRGPADADTTSGRGELYWKEFEDVSYAEAAEPYRDGDYATAVRKLHLFVQQNPNHSNAKMARFALGHCYLQLNNLPQARSVFRTLAERYPDAPLANQARTILETM